MQDICVFSSCAHGHDWQQTFQAMAEQHQLRFHKMLSSGKTERVAAEAYGSLKKPALDALRNSGAFDVNCVPAQGRRKSLLIADMDSTIIQQESLDHMAEIAGKGSEIAAITAAAMAGEIDFEQALDERLAMLTGAPAKLLDRVIDETKLTRGAAELVGTMRAHKAQCYLVSGGFTFLTQPIAKKLGFHGHYANELLLKNGRLTGHVAKPILDCDAKLSRLKALTHQFGLSLADAATIGDGANDLTMLKAAGMGVAFQGKPLLKKQIDIQLNHTDLTGLLFLQGYDEAEFCVLR